VLDWYYLEIREERGSFEWYFFDDESALGGVSIRVNDDPALTTRSRLLDTHPGTTSIYDAPLMPGETFSDGQVSITTLSAGGGDATVQITLPEPSPDIAAPSAPTGLRHAFTATGAVLLSWDASTDDTGVTGYAVFRDGLQIASTGDTFYEDVSALAGAHAYTVRADDAAGNRSAASEPHVVDVPGPDPGPGPGSTPGGSSDTGGGPPDRSGPRISIERRPVRNRRLLFVVRARDPSGVARLSIFVDGRRLKTTSGATLRHRWRKRPGRHRVVVRAIDAQGNNSSRVLRLRVRR
jgi:hypothetical protein